MSALRRLRHPWLALEAWLWRGGLHHERVRQVVLVELGVGLLFLGLGALLLPVHPWPWWCAVGFALVAQAFYGLARYFARVSLAAYGPALLLGAIGQMLLRLGLVAAVLYVALARCAAPPLALLCGVSLALVTVLATYALKGSPFCR